MAYLRFGIRDSLWAMLVVGLGLGWWLDHRLSNIALVDAKNRHDAELLCKEKQCERRKIGWRIWLR